nr:hypothetical protein [Tanacetum cinerariifolium]
MIAILEKYEQNTNFHPIVDFVEASHLRIKTTDEGTKILATVDGRTVPLFPSMLVTMGEGSGIPTEPHHTPTYEASQSSQHELPSPSLLPVPTELLPTVITSDNPPLRQYTRRDRIAQSLALPPVADEPASPIRGNSQGEACLTNSCLEGSMQQKLDELMALCTSLQRQQSKMISKFAAQELEINRLKARIKLLEDTDRGVAEQFGDDAPIKGKRLDEGEEAAERVSDDTEEMTTVLTSMDAASILTSGGVQVVPTAAEVATATVSIPTGSGVVSTASPTIPTASPIFTTIEESTPYIRRKEKETMVESKTPKKKKAQEQIDIAWDAEVARIHAEEELQMLINGLDWNNETIAKYLAAKKAPLKEATKRVLYVIWKQFQDFIPIGSKEEAERFKRKGVRLEHDSSKKLKTLEEVPEQKLKEMMELIPVEEVYVEALQIKHLIIDWEVHTEGERSYWKIVRLGGSTASYQFFMDLLKHFDREDLNQLWALVKEILNIRPATIEWKLYDTCGVHHVTSKDKEIFMLVEKDYPLRKGLVIVMISYKLQVENYSQMENDLILKIYKIANCPRQQDD